MSAAELRSSRPVAVDLNEKNVLAILKNHGIEVTALGRDNDGYAYSLGPLSNNKRFLLHRLGARWQAKDKCWVISFNDKGRVTLPALQEVSFSPDPAGMDWRGSTAGARSRLRQELAKPTDEGRSEYDLLRLLLSFSVLRDDVTHVANEFFNRFGDLAAVLGADPLRYAECFPQGTTGHNNPGLADAAHSKDLHLTQILLQAVHDTVKAVLKARVADRHLISSWTALMDYLIVSLRNDTTEQFRILFLDRKNQLIREEVQSRGTIDHTPLYPREVAKRCMELGASAIIMVHNHPSGDPTPSQPDIDMTLQVVETLKILGVTVHDHVIVGANSTISFRTRGLIGRNAASGH